MKSCPVCGAEVLYYGIFDLECAGYGCVNAKTQTLSLEDRLGALIASITNGECYLGPRSSFGYYTVQPAGKCYAWMERVEAAVTQEPLLSEIKADAAAWLESQKKSA